MTSLITNALQKNAVSLNSRNLASARSENFASLTEGHTIPIYYIDFKIEPNPPNSSHII